MTEIELRERILRGEDLHTEFKESPPDPHAIARSIVAFCNTDGGELILGVSNDGKIVGVTELERLSRHIDNIANNSCEPPISVVQETVDIVGRRVLVVHVPKGVRKPYRTNRGNYYVRTSSGVRDASQEELLRMFQSSRSLFYDEAPVFGARPEDIDGGELYRFLESIGVGSVEIPLEVLLRNLRLAVGEQANPTVAGILCFGRKPSNFIPYAYVQAARIRGVDLSEPPADAKRLDGTLFEILDQCSRFLGLHLAESHQIRGFEPEVVHEIPVEALREAAVNMLVHRDYTVSSPARLFVFDDRVEFHSPGSLPNTVTVDAMRLGAVHVLRNPTIYTLFARGGFVTGVGSGVFRMIRLMQKVGRDVGLEARAGEFVVTLPRPL